MEPTHRTIYFSHVETDFSWSVLNVHKLTYVSPLLNFGQICLGERSNLVNQDNSNVRTLGHAVGFVTTAAAVATETTTTTITIFYSFLC